MSAVPRCSPGAAASEPRAVPGTQSSSTVPAQGQGGDWSRLLACWSCSRNCLPNTGKFSIKPMWFFFNFTIYIYFWFSHWWYKCHLWDHSSPSVKFCIPILSKGIAVFQWNCCLFLFFTWTKRCLSSISLGSGTVSAETSNKIILKQYHGKLQVKPFQCDSFKSNDKTETFLQEKNCWILSSLPVFTELGSVGCSGSPMQIFSHLLWE